MPKFYLPADSAGDWQALLAEPQKHWRTGYSAKSLAYSWTEANGFPPEVARLFDESGHPELCDLEFLLGFPEHEVPLPGGRRASQNDIFVLARGAAGLVSIAVEGKVSEPFGPLVSEWIANPSKGRETRLAFLCDVLGVDRAAVADIRYQLLHRTASAIIEARRFHAATAVMLVHSFSQTHEWFDDFAKFARLYNEDPVPNSVCKAGAAGDTMPYLAWSVGNEGFLMR
jgi:hypothetical protein